MGGIKIPGLSKLKNGAATFLLVLMGGTMVGANGNLSFVVAAAAGFGSLVVSFVFHA